MLQAQKLSRRVLNNFGHPADKDFSGQQTVRDPSGVENKEGASHMNLFVLRTWLEAKFAKDERGASMVEYILLVALIALAVIAAVVFLVAR